MNGTIKRLNRERGFGVISGEDGGEYFFHQSGLLGELKAHELKDGQRVSFEGQLADKRPQASEVKPD